MEGQLFFVLSDENTWSRCSCPSDEREGGRRERARARGLNKTIMMMIIMMTIN
jgi:hypothetical protein